MLHPLCLLKVPMVGIHQYGYIPPAFSRSPWWGDINMATSTLPSRGPHGGQSSIWLHNPPHSRGPLGGETILWLHHPYLLGSPWWGEINMATNPCLLGVPMVVPKRRRPPRPCIRGLGGPKAKEAPVPTRLGPR